MEQSENDKSVWLKAFMNVPQMCITFKSSYITFVLFLSRHLDILKNAVSSGDILLIENISETVKP